MAILALQCRMGPKERESVYVAIRILHDFPPAANAVASRTIASKLAAMDIRMARGALLFCNREDQLHMALLAVQPCMHALQGELGASVIEVREWAYRSVACCGVTIPAVYLKGTMYTIPILRCTMRAIRFALRR
jgi:hypothetical protein